MFIYPRLGLELRLDRIRGLVLDVLALEHKRSVIFAMWASLK